MSCSDPDDFEDSTDRVLWCAAPPPFSSFSDLFWCSAFIPKIDQFELTSNDPSLGQVTVEVPDTLRHAVAKRRREFLVGRTCAAFALRQAGAPEFIFSGPSGPQWPKGFHGSISHTDKFAMAVVSSTNVRVGCDCETVLSPQRYVETKDLIASSAELSLKPKSWFNEEFATLVFSAKEAFYKAVHTSWQPRLSFETVSLQEVSDNSLVLSAMGKSFNVFFTGKDDMFLTLCMI